MTRFRGQVRPAKLHPRGVASHPAGCLQCVSMLRTQDLHVLRTEALVTPADVKREFPASDALYEVVLRARAAVRVILAGTDRRLLAVVGPCSIHDPEAALDYARRLRALSKCRMSHAPINSETPWPISAPVMPPAA